MIDLQKLEPIHTFNTPRGRILKHTPTKLEKLDLNNLNPQLSLFINSNRSFGAEKNQKSLILNEFRENTKYSPKDELSRTCRLLNYSRQRFLTKKNNLTLNFDSFEKKSFSQSIMRKKVVSVCYIRRQKAKLQLNQCVKSLYLKINSERISIEKPQIKQKSKSRKPYAKYIQQTKIEGFNF